MKYFSDDPKDKQATLDWARSLHEALNVYEPLQRDDNNIEHLLSAMLWPTSPFVRESLVGCYETNYKDFAQYTKRDLQAAMNGFTVYPIEWLHRNLNCKAAQNYNCNISRHMRWQTAMSCGLVEDNDFKQPNPTPEQRVEGQKQPLNAKQYEVGSHTRSLGNDVFKDLLNSKDAL